MLPQGPTQAKIMIVGDWPEHFDLAVGKPFQSGLGLSLSSMLHEAGILLNECLVSLVSSRVPPSIKGKEDFSSWMCHTKSPKVSSWTRFGGSWISPELSSDIASLQALISLVKPNMIIALGNLSLFALAGKTSVKKWRGSQLRLLEAYSHDCAVLPTYTPRYVQRDFSCRAITVHDLRRAKANSASPLDLRPSYTFVTRPDFRTALEQIGALQARVAAAPTKISVDIETSAGHLECIGFAADKTSAFCIPLMCRERTSGYWSELEEVVIVDRLRTLLTHPNAQCFGQNFIYDIQYIYRFWFFIPNTWYDTMNAQHVLFPGQPKGLDYLASLYCAHYVYWKDDGKIVDLKIPEDQRWTYNCEDCVRTFEVMEQQFPQIEAQGLTEVWDFQQNHLFPLLLKAMIRGVRCDTTNKSLLSMSLMCEVTEREQWIERACAHPLNIRSPKQMLDFFHGDLKQRTIISRKTGKPTLDDKALSTIAKREPALQELINKIQEVRSLGVFKSTFVDARLDSDHRLRSSYNIAGTETFRLSSSENAFGSGLNFQNIPKGSESDDPLALSLPNIRNLFLPDPGHVIFDMDLQSADLYTVVWEADDDEMRCALAEGIDMHALNAKNLFGLSCGVGEVKKLHNDKRQLAKTWCHATNYGAGAANMARACSITVREAERLRERWFQMHPGIHEWHRRAEAELTHRRRVSNVFGYRMVFFGRIEAALPEALAWTPQSTTGCVINRAWAQIAARIPEVEILIQVHDSLVGQYHCRHSEGMPERILAAARVIVPYDKPLIIPAGIATSTKSWGDCH